MAGNPEYPNRGTLWTSLKRTSDVSPHFYGSIAVERDYLLQLMEEQAGDPLVEIKLSGWREKDRDNNPRVSLKINNWKPDAPQAKPQSDEKDPWDD